MLPYDRPLSEIYADGVITCPLPTGEEVPSVYGEYDPSAEIQLWFNPTVAVGPEVSRNISYDAIVLNENNAPVVINGVVETERVTKPRSRVRKPNVPTQRWQASTSGRNNGELAVMLDLRKLRPGEKVYYHRTPVGEAIVVRDMVAWEKARAEENPERETLRLVRELHDHFLGGNK